MKCPRCSSTQISKNGRRNGKQNYLCKQCKRQFLESYESKGYSDDVKIICLRMHKNGMGFREIERVTGVNHNSIIQWAKQSENTTPDTSDSNASEDNGLKNSSDLQAHIECQKSRIILQNLLDKYAPGNNITTRFKFKFIFSLIRIKISKTSFIVLGVLNSIVQRFLINCNHESIMQL
jgi:CDP-glycerol glycerophosphotransferase (TagB/SpsB family)